MQIDLLVQNQKKIFLTVGAAPNAWPLSPPFMERMTAPVGGFPSRRAPRPN